MADDASMVSPVEPIKGKAEGRRVTLPDGMVLDLSSSAPPPDAESTTVRLLDQIEPYHFHACPICFADATDLEHVPPESLGGRVITSTCEDCNNRFGSPFEEELRLHTRNAIRAPAFSGGPVQGRRRAKEVTVYRQQDGAFAAVVDNPDPAVEEMLRNGSMDMSFRLPRPALWQTALLKQAYLAACVYLRQIPRTPHAEAVRFELLRARNAGTGHSIGPLAEAVPRIGGWGQMPLVPCLAVVPDEELPFLAVGMAGYGFVGWPIPDTDTLLTARMRQRLGPSAGTALRA